MAQGIGFPESNWTMGPPEGMTEDQVKPLAVHKSPGQFVSKWQLTPAEQAEVAKTGVVWVFIIGSAHPPIYIDGTYPFEVTPNES